MGKQKPQLLIIEALSTATADDLAELRAAIAEIRDAIAKQERQLDTLRQAERAITVAVEGKPREVAERIYEYLTNTEADTLRGIAEAIGSSPQGVGRCVVSVDWFERTADGRVRIAKKGD